ncbi:putative glycosyltransferase family 1 protein [Lyophyllum shimeji]|uniref:Glycosyltransferase family 1 protein n=1 Tax=Lyophyllum shimeji TaxID=47721 RepID=A0A9P3PGE6_LYOSH|nr:putative glycosyltransferase family 1 protein [Lyophyllum shimeji]
MQEIADNVAILPNNETGDTPVENARFVDIGSIQTDPKIDYAEWKSTGKGLNSVARVTEDGRIVVSLELAQKLPDLRQDYARDVEEFAVDRTEWKQYPSMNIVIMIVGSRGDVQPYVALGRRLAEDGHRIRMATHETFRSFVTDAQLEFFDIGGNPQDLMSYMVKNPGLIPGFTSLTNGDLNYAETNDDSQMMNGCWNACHSPCPTTGRTFAADAIISNPPAFAHVHCAEALGIPLLLSFTMPWSPTAAFPHPLVNIKQSNAERDLTNYLSYAIADLLTWQGIGDLVNTLRTRSLGLTPLTLRSGPGLVDRLKVPWTYCMSPALVPKPRDWKNHIDVVGFYFLDLATNYEPPDNLAAFLAAGEPPVYIGFGSVVVADAAAMTNTIFEATAQAGVRALVSAGWFDQGGLGGVSVPPHVFILGNVPHDWLFDNERVSAVVHHGGAGTTAVGLAKGRPTVVVPFFGDQGFWGAMIHRAGAGPEPISHKKLNVENLRDAIKFAVSPSAKLAARQMAEQIRSEDGVVSGVESFYRHLPLLNMRCDLDPSKLAVWWSTEHCLKLSAFAAQTLADAKQLDFDSLDIHRTKDYDSQRQVSDPVTGGAGAIFWTITHYYAGIAEIFYSPIKGIIHTTTAIPRGTINAPSPLCLFTYRSVVVTGVMDIVTSIHQGLHNAPKLYGSNVRKPGKVTDFASGVKEAGKGLFHGYYDGITGLVREPVEGAKKGGVLGAIKGSARSFVNVTMRPAAGIVGVVVHPLRGAWKSLQTATGQKQEHQIRITRISDGREAVRNSTAAQRAEITRKFKEAQQSTEARRRQYREIAEKVLREEVEDSRKADYASQEFTDEKSGGPSRSRSSQSRTASTPGVPGSSTTANGVDEGEDAAFERDMELAKQLSLAEQRGYERGVASRFP